MLGALTGSFDGVLRGIFPTPTGDWLATIEVGSGAELTTLMSDLQLLDVLAQDEPGAPVFWAQWLEQIREHYHLTHTRKPLC